MPQRLLYLLRLDTVAHQRRGEEVAQGVEGAYLRPSGSLAPVRPQLRPVGVVQQLPPRGGEQNGDRPSQPLSRGDVGKLELDGADFADVSGDRPFAVPQR